MSSSNPLCPECQVELEDDFGIVDCKSCGAVCSVDLDGTVQVQGEVGASEQEPAPETEEPPEEIEEFSTDDTVEDEINEESIQESTEENVEQSLEPSLEQTLEEDEILEVEAEPSVEMFKEVDVAEPHAAPLGGAEFLKDLELFTEESTDEGLDHTYYDLHISEMGSFEERQILIETLADSRLEISEDFLTELIGDEDSFVLKQLSFLRLSVVYKRLAPLSLKISWVLSEEQQPRAQEESLGDDAYSEESLEGEYVEEEPL